MTGETLFVFLLLAITIALFASELLRLEVGCRFGGAGSHAELRALARRGLVRLRDPLVLLHRRGCS